MDHLAAIGRAAAVLAFTTLQKPSRGEAEDERRSWLGPIICLLLAVAAFYWTLDWLQSGLQLAERSGP